MLNIVSDKSKITYLHFIVSGILNALILAWT